MESADGEFENLNEATPALTSSIKEPETVESAVRDDAISSTTSDKCTENSDATVNDGGTDCDAEADFLEAELNISKIASEKITENVEDIVQDLENLLGESSDYYGRDATDTKALQTDLHSTNVNKLESENATELLSSQEVTSADASLKVDETNNDAIQGTDVLETEKITQSEEKESNEITIVDSTDNSRTDDLCTVTEITQQDIGDASQYENNVQLSKPQAQELESVSLLPPVDAQEAACVTQTDAEEGELKVTNDIETPLETTNITQSDEIIQCVTATEATLQVSQQINEAEGMPVDSVNEIANPEEVSISYQINEAESKSLPDPQPIITEVEDKTEEASSENVGLQQVRETGHVATSDNVTLHVPESETIEVSEQVGGSDQLNEVEGTVVSDQQSYENETEVKSQEVSQSNEINQAEDVLHSNDCTLNLQEGNEAKSEELNQLDQINEAEAVSLSDQDTLNLQDTVSQNHQVEQSENKDSDKYAEVTTSECVTVSPDKPTGLELLQDTSQVEVLCDSEEVLKSMECLSTVADVSPFINQVVDELSQSTNVSDTGNVQNEVDGVSVATDYITQTNNATLELQISEDLPLVPDIIQYASEDVSELDLACKSIQMVSEKIDVDLPQHDLCTSQFLDIPPDENMSEQSIAIASIMNEMGENEGEVSSMLNLEDATSVPFTNVVDESLQEFICGDKLELATGQDQPEISQSTDEVMALSNEVNVELSQPLTVEVGETRLTATEEVQEIEEPSQSDKASLKMTITKTDNVHSILKIYNPDEPNLEAVEPTPKLASISNEQDEVPTTTTEILKSEVSDIQNADTAETDISQRCNTKLDSLSSTDNNEPISSNLAVDNNVQVKEKPAVKIELQETDEPVQPRDIEKASNIESKPTLLGIVQESFSPTTKVTQKQEATHSPKITIKPVIKPADNSQLVSAPRHAILKPEEAERESLKITLKSLLKSSSESHYVPDKYSPKITIKPIVKPVTKVSDNEYHSEDKHGPKITIKPIRKPTELDELPNTRLTIKPVPHTSEDNDEQRPNPKITIKPIMKPSDESDEHYSMKIKTKFSNEIESYIEERHSPKITIKPIPKPIEEYQFQSEERHSRLIIKPVLRTEFDNLPEERHSPKITIKPIKPPDDIQISVEDEHGAKVTIKPIPKEELEEKSAPRITIKPILKPDEYPETSSPRITIKPIMKPQEHFERSDDLTAQPFKLNIKPVMRPIESSSLSPKITIKPVPKVEPVQPLELIDFEEQIKQERIVLKIPKNRKMENERVKKIKVKLSKDHGVAQILPMKRLSSEEGELEPKHMKMEAASDLSISVVQNMQGISETKHEDVNIKKVAQPLEDDVIDPLSEIPVFEITLESATAMSAAPKPTLPPISVPPTPRKRGRPRKVPLEVREEFKDTREEVVGSLEINESSRPKRSCRGPSVRATLGIKPRKPRGGGRGRVGRPPGSRSAKKERRPYVRKNLIKDSMIPDFKDFDGEFKHVPLPIESGNRDVVIYEEETRMSADNSSRAQTPAKQVLTTSEVIEESQSSIQSNTTTESGEKLQKIRKGPRLEVHQEPEGEVISADKLAEYSWGGGGPYMLQEQVAQFLGIKSFKRKYPGIHRRPVDMQERDFIRESCLASEAMCDMGLTAVKREDILDIMYTDFQHKYEEYCKHQRDRQAKDVSNKQKALSLAASQEKNKLDIVEQAVQSAFQWNANFNKTRKEQRRACLDLQTFTVHYPKGKMKQINKQPPGLYPLALVPGQYSDYYKKYNSLELSRLPLNTVNRKTVSVYHDTEDSQSDGSGSDSDSSSSDSDSSYSGSSIEDCKMCAPVTPVKKILVH